MRLLPRSLLQSNGRKLEVSVGGRWYLLFTILLGVVAIFSGNNVIYLLESLLLSALILSGVLSEFTISRVAVSRELGQAEAGKPGHDLLVLENKSFLPLYCVEILEWQGESNTVLAFALYLPGRATLRIRSSQILPERGRHTWAGLAVATSFPFGFARKILHHRQAGSRVVWPHRPEGNDKVTLAPRPQPELEISLGDLAEVGPDEDISRVHWPSSARAGRLLARPFRRIDSDEEVIFHFSRGGAAVEAAISATAGRLRRATQTLLLFQGKEMKRISGALPALDALALLPKGPA